MAVRAGTKALAEAIAAVTEDAWGAGPLPKGARA